VRALAPACDVTHAHDPKGERTCQHLMSVNGEFDGITRDDLLAVAGRFGVRRQGDRLADVRGAVESWPEFAGKAELSAPLRDRVAKDLILH
jgi:serine/threonine-protein kinase HipA